MPALLFDTLCRPDPETQRSDDNWSGSTIFTIITYPLERKGCILINSEYLQGLEKCLMDKKKQARENYVEQIYV